MPKVKGYYQVEVLQTPENQEDLRQWAQMGDEGFVTLKDAEEYANEECLYEGAIYRIVRVTRKWKVTKVTRIGRENLM